MTSRRPRLTLAVLALLCGLATLPNAGWALVEPSSWPSGAAPLAAQDEPRHYLIALVDQPVSDVADEVLGGMLQLPIEASSSGLRMTLIVDQILTPAELKGRFDQSLRKAGAVIVRRDDHYVVERLAASAAAPNAVASAPSIKRAKSFIQLPPVVWALGSIWSVLITLGGLLFLNRRRFSVRAQQTPGSAFNDNLVETRLQARSDG